MNDHGRTNCTRKAAAPSLCMDLAPPGLHKYVATSLSSLSFLSSFLTSFPISPQTQLNSDFSLSVILSFSTCCYLLAFSLSVCPFLSFFPLYSSLPHLVSSRTFLQFSSLTLHRRSTHKQTIMSTSTQQLPAMDHSVYNSGYTQCSPPESSLPSSPEDIALSASSSTSSVDQLPPAFSAEGTTPAPCDTHGHMVSHHSEIVVVDEDSFEDIHHAPPPAFSETSRPSSPTPPRTTSTTLIVNPHPLSHSLTAAGLLASTSRPGTDEVESEADQNIRAVAVAEEEAAATAAYEDRLEATNLEPESPTHENIHFTPTFSSSTTSFFTAPAPHASHHVNRTEHHHMSSPFSFFANSSLAHGEHQNPPHVKTLRIELEKNQVVLSTGSTTKLEGTLYLNLKHSTKVKSLQLEFSGRSSVTWVDGKSLSPPFEYLNSFVHRGSFLKENKI